MPDYSIICQWCHRFTCKAKGGYENPCPAERGEPLPEQPIVTCPDCGERKCLECDHAYECFECEKLPHNCDTCKGEEMKSSNTDKHLNVRPGMGWSDEKFRDIQAKATDEYNNRKRNKKKKKNVKIPCYEPGDRIVLAKNSTNTRDYILVEVLDFYETFSDFKYYCIALKVTKENKKDTIGRLCDFNEGAFSFSSFGSPAHVPEDSITWLEG